MSEYLYRYVSFETFVGLIQRKALTFVLPELWDDPYECSWFMKYLTQLDNSLNRMLMLSVHYHTYCQSWTRLSESDAMWRIYSYGNRAVRIRIKQDDVKKLENIRFVDVEYSDKPEFPKDISEKSLLKVLSLKRTAFEHEKEVRLVKIHHFSGMEDAERHCKAWMALKGDPEYVKLIEELFPDCTMEQQVEEISKMLNIGKMAKETLDISFSHIPQFIDSVLLHPFAPEWYVDIVKEFCVNNGVPFDGKSNLYVE